MTILHDHLLALLHSGHEVEFATTEAGDFAVTVTRDADGETWTAIESAIARALWTASPLHADEDPFPGDQADPGRSEQAFAPTPSLGDEDAVSLLSAQVTDLGDRLDAIEVRVSQRDEAVHAVIGIIRRLMDEPPRPLPAPCGDYQPAEPYGPCTTCGRTREAHRLATRTALTEALADELEAVDDALDAITAEHAAGRIDDGQAEAERAQVLDGHLKRVQAIRATHEGTR